MIHTKNVSQTKKIAAAGLPAPAVIRAVVKDPKKTPETM